MNVRRCLVGVTIPGAHIALVGKEASRVKLARPAVRPVQRPAPWVSEAGFSSFGGAVQLCYRWNPMSNTFEQASKGDTQTAAARIRATKGGRGERRDRCLCRGPSVSQVNADQPAIPPLLGRSPRIATRLGIVETDPIAIPRSKLPNPFLVRQVFDRFRRIPNIAKPFHASISMLKSARPDGTQENCAPITPIGVIGFLDETPCGRCAEI